MQSLCGSIGRSSRLCGAGRVGCGTGRQEGEHCQTQQLLAGPPAAKLMMQGLGLNPKLDGPVSLGGSPCLQLIAGAGVAAGDVGLSLVPKQASCSALACLAAPVFQAVHKCGGPNGRVPAPGG